MSDLDKITEALESVIADLKLSYYRTDDTIEAIACEKVIVGFERLLDLLNGEDDES